MNIISKIIRYYFLFLGLFIVGVFIWLFVYSMFGNTQSSPQPTPISGYTKNKYNYDNYVDAPAQDYSGNGRYEQ